MKLYLITGNIRSGKDTVGDYLYQHYVSKGINVKKIALADELKQITRHMIKLFYNIDVPLEEFYDPFPYTLRFILQRVGTEI